MTGAGTTGADTTGSGLGSSSDWVPTWQLRARFALSLSQLYGSEVPAYNTLVDVAAQVNASVLADLGPDAERLGSIERVTAERHGAIRLGTAAEIAQVGRIFAAFGMHPVGYYDLRDGAAPVPVVSTAFRPITAVELGRNPFRVFTSLLAVGDRRFFDEHLQRELEDFLATRELFPADLLELADQAVASAGLDEESATAFLGKATAAFAMSEEPVNRAWYEKLSRVSAVAADIGGVSRTHINHLTPRVLDIDALYRAMTDRGIEMISEIQGPPRWSGPPVLLRQTSFRALAETRMFRETDGSLSAGTLRVRFGEVEQRGIALTPAGRDRYDALIDEIDRYRATAKVSTPAQVQRAAAAIFDDGLPGSEDELAETGSAYFTYALGAAGPGEPPTQPGNLTYLVKTGRIIRTPQVYEDFLPRSAAGIFASNLAEAGTVNTAEAKAPYDADWLQEALRRPLLDPMDLYQAEQDSSLLELQPTFGPLSVSASQLYG